MVRPVERRWTGTPDFPSYIISDKGDIRRVIKGKGAQIGRDLKLIPLYRISDNETGNVVTYYTVFLRKNGKNYHRSVRKLIARAFGQNKNARIRENKVVEIDGNRAKKERTTIITQVIDMAGEDLDFDNIRWTAPFRGERHPARILTNSIVQLIRNNQDLGLDDFISRYGKFGVSRRTIQSVLRGNSWRHRSEPFAEVSFPNEENIDVRG